MRIDMTARDWANLVKPVLPHTVKDGDLPELSQVRIEVGHRSLYAVATDRYTMGAERHPLAAIDRGQPQPPVHVRASDIAASLKLLPYTKDDDPPLTLTIDTVRVPVLGNSDSYSVMAVTLESAGAGKLVMHDRRMGDRDPLKGWQHVLSATLRRSVIASPSGLGLSPLYLGRWAAAVRAAERLTLWTGERRKDPILVTVEDHFAGIWMPAAYGDDSPPPDPAGLPWLAELDGADPATGELLDADQ